MFVNSVKKYSGNLLVAVFLATFCFGEAFGDQELWYSEPSTQFQNGIPLGNGRLGMVVNGTADEHIVFNENSIWSGWYEEDQDRAGSFKALQELRALIAADAPQKEILAKAENEFASKYGYYQPSFGMYQTFFDAHIDFGHDPEKMSDYRRSLDLETAVSDVTYSYQGANFKREYFTSYPDQVGMMHFSSDKPGSINLTFSLTSGQSNSTVSVINGDTLLFDGAVEQRHLRSKKLVTGEKSVQFEARLKFKVTGGKIRKTRDENNKPAIQITNADDVVVTCAGATNYKLSHPTYTGEAPAIKNKAVLSAIAGKTYAELKAAHIADYSNLFSKVDFSLEGTDRSDLPTDVRLKKYKKDNLDRDFETLVFQFGRYLLIAGSRPGNLPTNLLGIWNKDMKPAWLADFHLNINFQMNYWLADVCNLSECFEPLTDWAMELQKPGEKTAQVHYNSKGWVVHHVANIWGSTVPGPKRAIWMYETESGAFLMQNIWDHYAYTQDLDYLQNKAWPLMKGCAEFWMDNLQELPNGDLCVSPAYSPEHGPMTDDAFWHTMIVWDLFDNCIKATEILDTDHAFARRLKAAQAKIQKPIIGEFGQLQEWRDPAIEIETDVENNTHRHISHMYAVYPGHQIIPERDPAFAQACIKSMQLREQPKTTAWSFAVKISTWARLFDSEMAYKQVSSYIKGRVYISLISKYPYLVDGCYGYSAGVAEMLMQSHNPGTGHGNIGKIHFLPALPSDWPAGSIRGLKARGNVLVDLVWKDGKATEITVQAAKAGTYTFVYGTKEVEVKLAAGVPTPLGSYFGMMKRSK